MNTLRSAASHAPGSTSCWQRNWPRIFLVGSLVVAVLSFVGIIMGFVKIFVVPNEVLLNVYCLIFCLLGLSAELRQFSLLRRIVYTWMRYFYFLTYYRARGIFYILFGVLMLGTGVVEVIAGALAITLGAVMLLVGLVVDLPTFEDAAEKKRVQEEFQRYYGGDSGSAAATTTTPAPPKPASQTARSGATSASASAAPASQTGGAKPASPPASVSPPRENATTAPNRMNLYQEYSFGESKGYEDRTAAHSGDTSPREEEHTFQVGKANMFAS